MKILKQIGVHDVDPKSPKYGHPLFKAYMKKYLPLHYVTNTYLEVMCYIFPRNPNLVVSNVVQNVPI